MVDKMQNTLGAASRSLRQVVVPAIDGTDALAAEQVELVAGILDFYSQRAALEYPRKAYEYEAYRVLLCGLERDHGGEEFWPDMDPGLYVLPASTTFPPYSALDDWIEDLTEAIGMISRSAAASRTSAGRSAVDAILQTSTDLVMMERAWFLPRGGDPDEDSIPEVEDLLFATRTTSRVSAGHR